MIVIGGIGIKGGWISVRSFLAIGSCTVVDFEILMFEV